MVLYSTPLKVERRWSDQVDKSISCIVLVVPYLLDNISSTSYYMTMRLHDSVLFHLTQKI